MTWVTVVKGVYVKNVSLIRTERRLRLELNNISYKARE